MNELRMVKRESLALLAKILNCSVDELIICRDLIVNDKAYYEWETPKASGGMRQITSPVEELKEMQRRIMHILLYSIPIHLIAHGFCRDRDIFTNAQVHSAARTMLNLDLKDAFPSTRENRVAVNLKKPLVRNLRMQFRRAISDENIEDILHMIVRLCTFKGCIPQGAPTSPAILNIVCMNMDAELYALASKHNLTVSRYADDITFSSSDDEISGEVRQEIRSTISRCGWKINQKKVQYLRRRTGRQLEVTGLVIDPDGKVRIPAERRRHYAEYLTSLLAQDELTPQDRASATGIIVWISRANNGFLPSSIAKKWGALKKKFGIGDAPEPKMRADVSPYHPDIPKAKRKEK